MPFTPEELSRIYDDYHAGQSASIPSSPKFTVDQLSQIYDQYQAENAKPVRGTAGEIATGGLLNLANGLTLGAGDEIVAGGNALIDALQGNDFGYSYDQRLSQARNLRQGFRDEAPILATAQDIGSSFLMPLGAISKFAQAPTALGRIAKNAAVGAGLGGATAFGEGEGGAGNRIVDALKGAAIGGTVGGGATGILEGAKGGVKYLAEKAPQWAENQYNAAMGAGKGMLAKSARQEGIQTGKGQRVETELKKALRAVREDGVLDGAKTSADILETANAKASALSKEIGSTIDRADQALNGQKVYPEFTNAINYIETKAPANEREGLRKELNRWMEAVKSEGDGSLSFLQNQKIQLGNRTYAAGQQTADDFDKALTADFRETIEKTSDKVLPNNPRPVRKLNSELANYMKVFDVLEDAVATNEGRTVGKNAMAIAKTTGGIMGTTIGGLLATGGNPLGGVAGGIGGTIALWLQTPGGKMKLARSLEKAAKGAAATSPRMSALDKQVLKLTVAQRGALKTILDQSNVSAESSRPAASRSALQMPQVRPPGAASSSQRPPGGPRVGPKSFPISQDEGRSLSKNRSLSTLEASKSLPSSLASSPEDSQLPLNSTPLPVPKITRENKELFQRVASEAIGKLPPLVQAMVSVESNGKIDAVSKKGAKGLLQLMPENVKRFKVADPFNPLENIRGGMALMREELDRFGDVKLALAAYNAGSPRVQAAIKAAKSDKFVDVYPYLPEETQGYVARVLSQLNQLEDYAV
ncbi:MAG: hypothetical protein E6Q97_00825 [Desulfurellales bacterium]|nr:MAG: hypothetical protein E6Q97_00825 [Desulfurellales bacterium]